MAFQSAANEWYDEQGTKNGGHRIGWQPNALHQGQFQGKKAQQIQGIAPPNQRDAVVGAHADAFVKADLRGHEQQLNPLITNPEQGPPAGDVGAQRNPDSAYLLWQQQQNAAVHLGQQAGEADPLSEHEFLDEAASPHKGASNPIRPESAKPRSAPYEREDREQSPGRQRCVSRARLSSRSASPAPSTIPECYTVTSDMEDENSRAKSTAKLNREIKEHRRPIARADPTSGIVETLRSERDKLSSIVSRRKRPKQREELCTKRIHAIQYDIDTKLDAVQKCENNLNISLISESRQSDTGLQKYQILRGAIFQ